MKKNTGFTLLEVLIAMVVLAIGLLGLAGLQATGLSNNQSAYYRSHATQLAYDIADRIRANSSQIATYLAPTAALTPGCLSVASCTPQQLANHDISEWNTGISTLPRGIGSMAQTAGGGTANPDDDVFTITINWDDDKDGDVDNSDANFSVSFTL